MSYEGPVPHPVNSGGTGKATLNSKGILFGNGTSAIGNTSAGSAGQVLQSNGAGVDPSFSTATFPASAGSTGTILRSDGTNWVATTATYPATTTISQVLYSSAANTVTGLATANNSVLLTNATGVPSLGTSLSNNFTFTTATSGATETLTVSNTSDTANSSALQQVTVAGTSGGDAFTTYTVSGATNWSQGVDNSASDAFVLAASTALGTTNVMSASTAGEINYPLQPAFLAYLGANVANVSGAGTAFTLGTTTALTEVFDQNGDFVTSGTFTAPVTGRYQFWMNAYITDCTICVQQILVITTSNRVYQVRLARAASNADWENAISYLCDMDAADTTTFVFSSTGEVGDTNDLLGNATNVFTGCAGYLVC